MAIFAALPALSFVLSCGGTTRPPAAPPGATTEPSVTEVQRAVVEAPTPVSPSLAVSDEIVRLCRLDLDNVERAPKFAFDRSELLPEDHEVLDKIGRCVNDGALGWVSLQLVGRADPRGSVSYNHALGQRRAQAVAAALRDRGVAPSLIWELSRGELDAKGTNEASWAVDRRVDITAFRVLGVEE